MKTSHLILAAAMLISSQGAMAQQQANFSMAPTEHSSFSPAVVGLNDNHVVQTGIRQQWLGISGAPTELLVTGNFRYRNRELRDLRQYATRLPEQAFARADSIAQFRASIKHGLGFMVYSESFGPNAITSISTGYAVHYPLNRKLTLSLGLRVGLRSERFSTEGASVLVVDDQRYNERMQSTTNPLLADVDFGARLDHRQFFIGYTATQLTNGRLLLNKATTMGNLSIHQFAFAGYRIGMPKRNVLETLYMVKHVAGLPIAHDVMLRWKQHEGFWIASGLRGLDAAIAAVGGKVLLGSSKYLSMSYAFEVQTGPVNGILLTSHEIRLGVILF